MAAYDVTTAGAKKQFEATDYAMGSCAYVIDSNHYLLAWGRNSGAKGVGVVMAIDTSTWAITTANSQLIFDTRTLSAIGHTIQKVDTNHFIDFWTTGDDAYGNNQIAEVLAINTSTWAITTANSKFVFDTAGYGRSLSSAVIDANHFICFYNSYVDAFAVNTSTWAITTASTKLQFETQILGNTWNNCCKIDTNHYINFFSGNSDGRVTTQVFVVNTTTFAVTTAGSRFDLDTNIQNTAQSNSCFFIDSNHVINFWATGEPKTKAQVVAINTSTWAVTTAGAVKDIEGAGSAVSCQQIDANHFILIWGDGGTNTDIQAITVNTSTWAVTTTTAKLAINTNGGFFPNLVQLDASHYIASWGYDQAGTNGYTEIVYVEPNVAAPTVTTQAVTAPTLAGGTGNGNVTADGGATITERGVVVSTSSNPTTSDNKFSTSGTTGAFTVPITGLSPNTLYHVRAYAINSVGTSYGSDVTFFTSNDITKSLKYTVVTVPSAKTKGLIYDVKSTPSALTKALKYVVTITPSAITKGLIYAVDVVTSITKSLRYVVKGPVAITKGLIYDVKTTPSAITKGLTYDITITPSAIQKSLQYEVIKENAITKDLGYAIKTSTDWQLDLQYVVQGQVALTKSLKYDVITTPAAIEKGLDYIVAQIVLIQKSLQYVVEAQVVINKSLKYTITVAPSAIQKGLEYTVTITPGAITKSLEYKVAAPMAITKSLSYGVEKAYTITKSLRYMLPGPHVLTKSLKYSMTATQHIISKSMRYVIRVYPYRKKASPYHRLININD